MPDVDAVEGIGARDLLDEYRSERGPAVLEIVQGAVEGPDRRVEIAVAVEVGKSGHGIEWRCEAIERIGGADLLDEDRRRRGPGVLEIVQRSVKSADDRIDIAIAVQI